MSRAPGAIPEEHSARGAQSKASSRIQASEGKGLTNKFGNHKGILAMTCKPVEPGGRWDRWRGGRRGGVGGSAGETLRLVDVEGRGHRYGGRVGAGSQIWRLSSCRRR